MRKMKYAIIFLMLFMVIGYATVSVSLSINGNANVVSDLDDFNVYFSNVLVNEKENWTIVENEKELVFDVTLNDIGDIYKITYDVTNGSKLFDASLSINCSSGNEYLGVLNEFDTSNLPSLTTRTGNLTLTKTKTNSQTDDRHFTVTCTIVASPVGRDTIGNGNIVMPVYKKYAILKSTKSSDKTAFRSDKYKEKIKTITFEERVYIRENEIEVWDISSDRNESIIAYVTPNENDSSYYDLYIQSDKPMYANKDMSYWFYNMKYVDSINGLELLDTSMTTNMSYMFNYTGYLSTVFTLDVSGFDTSSVTNMSNMFYSTGYNNPNFTLDVSNFDTSKVIDMSSMFFYTGNKSTVFTLDVSGFNTSKVTSMKSMFYQTGYINPNFTLDVSNFDTSKVIDMSYMFFQAGKNSTKLNTSITIRNPSVTSYTQMFLYTATNTGSQITVNYTSATSSLVDQMIATKSSTSNVVKGVQVD